MAHSRKKGASGGQEPPQSGTHANGAGPAQRGGHLIDVELVKSLIAAVDESGIDTLEISRAGTRIRISKTAPVAAGRANVTGNTGSGAATAVQSAEAWAPAASPPEEPKPANDFYEVTSPMVGTFYRAPAPEAPPYVELGSAVTPGQTLCILEAMKLMNELESEVEGVVREILVENADPVEYGQVLFRIERSGNSGA